MFDLSWFGSIGFDGFLPALLGAVRHDFGWLGWISFDYAFLSALLSIILIDLVLAGDNAVVIALAVRNLEGKQKRWGIILGAGAAVMLRIVCTMFVAQMLMIPLLKFVGGALIAWIAVKLLTQEHEDEKVDQAKNLIQAIKLIVIADIVMSLDNMLAVGGASKGNMFLLLFGLGMSIPLVVGTSSLLSLLMGKYPIIVVIGSAVLGKVAGEMITTDALVQKWFALPHYVTYIAEVTLAIGVVVVGKLIMKRRKARKDAAEALRPQIVESEPEKTPVEMK
ncbi:TerC family protein [Candidatus Deferrimicrobium sp.]|uniref:TerC family protein n=1 Tax=Candidatus Deferrimicrobium sp. TaxID=3060586 RepID=UPI002EDAD257